MADDDLDDFFDEIEEAEAEVAGLEETTNADTTGETKTEEGSPPKDAAVDINVNVSVDVDVDVDVAAPPPAKRIRIAAASAPARPRGAVVAAAAASGSGSSHHSQPLQQQQQLAPPPPPPPPPPMAGAYHNNRNTNVNNNDNYFGPGTNANMNIHGTNLPPLPTGPMPPPPPKQTNHYNNNNRNTNETTTSTANGTDPTTATYEKSGKPVVRMAGGKSWIDSSLADWPRNDFRIFVGNLGGDVSDPMFDEYFRTRYPSVALTKIVRDFNKDPPVSKGFGFVSFLKPLDCARAIREQDQQWLGSRPIRVKRSDWQERNRNTVQKKKKREAKQQKRRY
uniref:RRM domain-containing protein n=1 Tax=Pseudo-nitzschia australis TaxID=44445 RepID=A0A7S4EJG7_9STRA|mmetsp:Transcript_5678/g.12393  ORF Transcript_5678/g.12393 Transcript_5678/m.12393 type:complete len:336 (-) Transcript_5678:168-1175(-)